jgi:endonuclease-3
LAALKRDYFDWNEVRVSTIRELTEAVRLLVNPAEAAARLKQTLHSVFESVYQFDIETLRKQNIGQAVKLLHNYNGTTPFVVAYVTQMALGGHAIPVNRGALLALHTVGVISDDEFAKGVVPGLERAVSKSKGVEIASLLHQLGVEVGRNPYGQAARKLLLEIAPGCKDRLPKRSSHSAASEQAPPAAPSRPGPPAAAHPAPKRPPDAKRPARGAAARPSAEKRKKAPPAKPPKAVKKATKAGQKKKTKRGSRPTTGSRRLSKRKPR